MFGNKFYALKLESLKILVGSLRENFEDYEEKGNLFSGQDDYNTSKIKGRAEKEGFNLSTEGIPRQSMGAKALDAIIDQL